MATKILNPIIASFSSSTEPSTNFDAYTKGINCGNEMFYPILAYDLSSIPAGATITGASLSLSVNTSGSQLINIWNILPMSTGACPIIPFQWNGYNYATGKPWLGYTKDGIFCCTDPNVDYDAYTVDRLGQFDTTGMSGVVNIPLNAVNVGYNPANGWIGLLLKPDTLTTALDIFDNYLSNGFVPTITLTYIPANVTATVSFTGLDGSTNLWTVDIIADDSTENTNIIPGERIVVSSSVANNDQSTVMLGIYFAECTPSWAQTYTPSEPFSPNNKDIKIFHGFQYNSSGTLIDEVIPAFSGRTNNIIPPDIGADCQITCSDFYKILDEVTLQFCTADGSDGTVTGNWWTGIPVGNLVQKILTYSGIDPNPGDGTTPFYQTQPTVFSTPNSQPVFSNLGIPGNNVVPYSIQGGIVFYAVDTSVTPNVFYGVKNQDNNIYKSTDLQTWFLACAAPYVVSAIFCHPTDGLIYFFGNDFSVWPSSDYSSQMNINYVQTWDKTGTAGTFGTKYSLTSILSGSFSRSQWTFPLGNQFFNSSANEIYLHSATATDTNYIMRLHINGGVLGYTLSPNILTLLTSGDHIYEGMGAPQPTQKFFMPLCYSPTDGRIYFSFSCYHTVSGVTVSSYVYFACLILSGNTLATVGRYQTSLGTWALNAAAPPNVGCQWLAWDSASDHLLAMYGAYNNYYYNISEINGATGVVVNTLALEGTSTQLTGCAAFQPYAYDSISHGVYFRAIDTTVTNGNTLAWVTTSPTTPGNYINYGIPLSDIFLWSYIYDVSYGWFLNLNSSNFLINQSQSQLPWVLIGSMSTYTFCWGVVNFFVGANGTNYKAAFSNDTASSVLKDLAEATVNIGYFDEAGKFWFIARPSNISPVNFAFTESDTVDLKPTIGDASTYHIINQASVTCDDGSVQIYPNQTVSATTLVFDNFTRANSGTLGTATDGTHAWTNQWGANMGISSNQAYFTANSTSIIDTVNSSYADVDINCVFATQDYASGGAMWLVLRFQDTGHFIYLTTAGGTYNLYDYNGGSPSSLWTSSIVPVNGDIVELNAIGTIIQVYINKTLVGTAADYNYLTSTLHGIGGNTSTGNARFGEFFVNTPKYPLSPSQQQYDLIADSIDNAWVNTAAMGQLVAYSYVNTFQWPHIEIAATLPFRPSITILNLATLTKAWMGFYNDKIWLILKVTSNYNPYKTELTLREVNAEQGNFTSPNFV